MSVLDLTVVQTHKMVYNKAEQHLRRSLEALFDIKLRNPRKDSHYLGGDLIAMEKEKLVRAKEILRNIANGVNPLNGERIEDSSFLHDPRIIRCLYFVQEVLDKAITGNLVKGAGLKFSITPEEKSKIELPVQKIGVNEFAKSVNKVIDVHRSKKLSGVELNRQLKKMGILAELITEDGKTRTVINERSMEFGIETEKRVYNGNEYEMILFNDKGKKFLLDNLEKIMTFEAEPQSV